VTASTQPFSNWGESGIPDPSALLTLKASGLAGPSSPCARLKDQAGRIAPSNAALIQKNGGVKKNYQIVVTTKNVKIYRAYSSKTGHGNSKIETCLLDPTRKTYFGQKLGSWWSLANPKSFGSKAQYRTATSICTAWNLLTHVQECTLRKGSVVAIGASAQAVSACKADRERLEKSPGCKDVDKRVFAEMRTVDGKLHSNPAHQVYINVYGRKAGDATKGRDSPLMGCKTHPWGEVEAYLKFGDASKGGASGASSSASSGAGRSGRGSRAGAGRGAGGRSRGSRFQQIVREKLAGIIREAAELEEAISE